jgi:hypothetical protein
MESIAINGKQVNVQGIKELKSGLSIQEATTKTKKNGIDEVYFSVDGKNFLAYGDALDLKGLSRNNIATITYNNRQGNLVAYEDEANSFGEGLKMGAFNGLKNTRDAVLGAVKNTITSIGPTGALLAGGALGIAGIAMWRGAATGAAATGAVTVAASPIGNLLGDILKNGSIGALKVIAVAGAIGIGVTAVAGAIGGVSEAMSNEKDYSTIAFVTKDGNQGAAEPTVQTAQYYNEATIFGKPDLSTQFNSVSSFLSNR